DRLDNDRRVIKHHDQHENCGHQRKTLEENRQRIAGIKIPKPGGMINRRRQQKETGDENHTESHDSSQRQRAFLDFLDERFEKKNPQSQKKDRDLEGRYADHDYFANKY